MAKTSALSSGGEAIHTRTDGSGTAESQVAVIGIDGSNSVVAADTSGLAVRGSVSHFSPDDGAYPLKVGGIYQLAPGSVNDGDRTGIQTDKRGRQRVVMGESTASNDGLTTAINVQSDGNSNSTVGPMCVLGYCWNGSSMDRLRGDTTNGLDVDVTRLPALVASSANIGDVDVLTVPAPLSTTGGGTEATALRVTVANNSTGVLPVTDNGGSLTVDNATISVVGSGTEATAQRVTIATDSTGVLSVDDNGGSLTVDGTVTVGALPGSLTGKAEDTASSPADVGIPNLGVRNDTPTVLTDTDGDYTMMSTDKYGRTQIAPVRSLPKTVGVTGSIGITTAATWDERAVWAVPASTLFAPKLARSAVTTASTRTLILAGKQLATFNPGTNAFTATGSVTGNDFYDRLMYRIAVTHSATADTMTATYTDQDGNTGNTTTGLVIPSAAVAGDWYEFILAANDFGVKAVTAFADTAAPTSVVDEVWGFRTLLEDLGTAITPHIAYLGEGLQVPNGESIVILMNAAATTAQQRFASVVGDLVAA